MRTTVSLNQELCYCYDVALCKDNPLLNQKAYFQAKEEAQDEIAKYKAERERAFKESEAAKGSGVTDVQVWTLYLRMFRD